MVRTQEQLSDPTADEAPMGAEECMRRIAIGEEHALGARRYEDFAKETVIEWQTTK
jgi:hypothetical protein